MANCACNCAVTSAAPAVSTSACEPACDFTRRLLAVEVVLLELDVLLGEIDQRDERFERRRQLVVVAARGCELGLRLLEREAVGDRIEREQLIAGLDVLALDHGDVDDLVGNIRRDQHLLRADVSVVGGDVAAAGEIERKPISTAIAGNPTSRIMRRRLRPNRAKRPDFPAAGASATGEVLASGAGTILRGLSLMTDQPLRATSGCALALMARRKLSFRVTSCLSMRSIDFSSRPSSTVSIMSPPSSVRRASSGLAAAVR